MRNKIIRIYKSHEEAAAADAAAVAKQSPQDRIRETVELILRVYGVTREQLNNRNWKKEINIVRYK